MWRLLLASALAASAAASPGAAATALGCNAQPPGGRNLVFADLVKTSMFGQPLDPGSQNTTVDARGWPTQDFSVSVYNEGATKAGFSWPPVK